MLRTLVLGMLLGPLLPGPPAVGVRADEPPPDPDLETERMRRAGPFHLQPMLLLKDVGYDDNVRFEAQNAEGDTTATAGAGLDAVLLTRNRGGFRFYQEVDYVAFQNNTELNHWNSNARARGILLLKRVVLSLEDRFASDRERPSTEIDRRTRRNTNAVTAAARTLGTGRLGILALARHKRIDFSSENASEEEIAQRLNRDENSLSVAGEVRVLPKTRLILAGVLERVAFEDPSEGRDSRARSVLAGFRFDPSASLQGEFRLGVIALTAPDRPQSDHRGTVGQGRLSTRLGRRARLKATFDRDLVFSILADNLFYVSTTWSAAYEQFFSRRLSGEVLYGRGLNHYPEVFTPGGADPFSGIRDDHLTTYQLGVRYRINDALSLDLIARRQVRDSTDDFFDRERNLYTFGSSYNF